MCFFEVTRGMIDYRILLFAVFYSLFFINVLTEERHAYPFLKGYKLGEINNETFD